MLLQGHFYGKIFSYTYHFRSVWISQLTKCTKRKQIEDPQLSQQQIKNILTFYLVQNTEQDNREIIDRLLLT